MQRGLSEIAKAAVRGDKEAEEWFHTSKGTRQGDPHRLYHFMFSLLIMDNVITHIQKNKAWNEI